MKVNKEVLLKLGLPYDYENVELDEVINNSRWSIHHRIIFKYTDNKFYQAYYSVGATEMQDERPWGYENEVELIEVELKEVTIKKWVIKENK